MHMNMKKLISQLFKFGIVGGIAFLIDYAIFALLTLIGINYLIAQIISFTISLMFNYIASVKWVFDTKTRTKNTTIVFILLSIIGLELNEILLYIGVDILNYHELIVKLFATVVVMIFNFITRKLILEKYENKLTKKSVIEIAIITLLIGVLSISYYVFM